nr:hypothetical protein [Tanacetum cinerariifolium]
MVNQLGTLRSKESEHTLEDECKDLHLNLPILKVIAYALIYNAILDKYLESLVLGENESSFIQGKMPKKMKHHGLFTLPCRLGDFEPFDTLADLGSCVNLITLYLFKKLAIGLLEENGHVFGLADGTKSYLVGVVKNIEVHIGRLKLLEDLKAKIAVGEGITMSVFGVKEIDLESEEVPYWTTLGRRESFRPRLSTDARDAELNPFKDILVFRKTVEFLGSLPINLKVNMWESKDLIENPINWDKPPKNGDRAWHTKIRIIDPDGE